MSDTISRQAAIDEIARWIGYLDDDMIGRIQLGLKRLPSAETKTKCIAQIKVDTEELVRRIKEEYDITDGWIPCSERLPREEEQDDELGVLVTLGNGYSGLQCDWYHGDHWYDWDGFVVAWMPLPPVYQEGDNK